MSTTPNPAAATPVPRQLTQGEIQRWVTDAWVAMNVRLSPGKLHTSCANRVQVHARQNFLSLLEQARDTVFSNYKEAVRLLADAYYRSVIALRFEPNALDWIVKHPSVTKRRELELQNRGLEAQTPSDVPERAKLEQEFADKVAADKAHEHAVRDIEIAISGIVFQNFRGIDQAEIDRVRGDLRKYVKENLSKSNGVKILRIVKESIAGAHQAYERKQMQWNSR